MAEAPNTLRSRALLRVVELLSEGEIVGLLDGDKSIFFDDTPLRSPDDTLNFKNIQFEAKYGAAGQTALAGFDSVETEVAVSRKVTQSFANGGLGPYTFTVSDTAVDAIRMKMRVPALVFTTNKGKLKSTSVRYTIEVQPNGGAYATAVDDTVSGKTTSPYERQYRIDLEGTGPWNVRVTRITADSTETTLQNETYVASYTTLKDVKPTYQDSAVVGMVIPAESFGGSIPRRGFLVKGLKIQVPQNYDPDTRTYATTGPGTTNGAWDGTFKTAWTDNPAWVFYDLCTSKRYGLGEYIPAASVDKWALYGIAQYCDELVSDGYGGQEPRFACNVVLSTAREAFEVLQYITSVFRGMAYWGAGAVTAVQDSPKDPVQLVTPANVIGGEFTYQSSSLKDRHSVAMVEWNDPADMYRTAVEVVEIPEAIERYGYRPVGIRAYGCTSRGQAYRTGRWLLDTEVSERESVVYACSFDHLGCRPGDIIEIADPKIAGTRQGGRLATGSTTTSFVLDAPLQIFSGDTLSTVKANGDLMEVALNATGSAVTTVTSATPLPETPRAGAVYIIGGGVVNARPFRVVSVKETDKHLFEVHAVAYDPNKFARVEQNLAFDPINYGNLGGERALPPTALAFSQTYYRNANQVRAHLVVSWVPPTTEKVPTFEYRLTTPSGGGNVWEETLNSAVEIEDAELGDYTFEVRSRTWDGRRSVILKGSHTITGKTDPPGDITSPSALGMNGQVALSWVNPDDDYLDYVEIWGMTTTVPGNAVIGNATQIAEIDGSGWIHPGLTPGDVWYYWLRPVDQVGNFGNYTARVNATVQALATGIVGYLTNESHTVATASDGSGGTYTSAGGTFKVFDGVTDKTGDAAVAYSVQGTPTGGLSISIAPTGIYTVTGLTSDEGQATLRAVYDGVTLDKTYSISKSKAGTNGTAAKLLSVVADSQTFKYDGDGVLIAPSTIAFTATQQGSSATINWKTQYWNGSTWVDTATNRVSPTTGLTTALTETAFVTENKPALRVLASFTDGTTYSDSITISKVQDGADGAAGVSPTQYYIKPLTGTAIKNGTGTLTLEAHQIANGVDTALTTGTIQLFVGATMVTVANGYATGSNGYTGVFDTGDINGSVVVTLKDGSGGAALDTVTLVDIDDGAAGTDAVWGYVVMDGPAGWVRGVDQSTWTPTATTRNLDFTFKQGTADVARYRWVITRDASGTLTGAAGTHPSGNLNTARLTVTEINESSQSMGVRMDYSFSGLTASAEESVTAVLSGTNGSTAKTIVLTSDKQAFTFDGSGTATPSGQYITLTVYKQNTTNTVNWTTSPAVSLRQTSTAGSTIVTTGDTVYLHAADFAANTSVTVTATVTDGSALVDKVTVVKLQDGADGSNAMSGYLTNEAHTVATAADGTAPAYGGGFGGNFVVFDGTTNVSSNFALSTQSNPQNLTVGYSNQTYTITGAGTTAGQFGNADTNTALLTIRATGSGAYTGITLDKVFTLTKSKTGSAGADAVLYYIKPTTGTAIQNGTGTLTLEAHQITGAGDVLLSSGNVRLYVGGTTEVTAANGFVAGSNGFTGILDAGDITGSIVVELRNGSGGTLLDTVTLVDVTDGASGQDGDDAVFGYVEPTNGLAYVKAADGGSWNTTGSTTLEATFVKAGAAVARIARQVALNTGNGTLTVSTVAHSGGDLNTGNVTVTVTGSGTSRVTVEYAYVNGADSFTVSETVLAVMGGSRGTDASLYYIRPTVGTAIKNGVGTLTLQARRVDGTSDILLSTGTVKLYDPSDNLVTLANGYVTGSDGYTGILDTGDINGSKTITLKDGVGGTPLDTVTLVDIDDGLNGDNAVYGYVTADGPMVWVRGVNQSTWTPSGTTRQLNFTFVQGGAEVARYAWVLTRDANGILTGVAGTHSAGTNLNTSRLTVTEVNESSQSMSVKMDYSFGGDTASITETVSTNLSGANGADGLSVAELVIYRRSATALVSPTDTPTGGSYNFGTQTLTAPTSPATWYSNPPAGNDPLYVCRGVASVQGTSGTDASITWVGPVLLTQEGAGLDIVFKRSATQPTTPSPSSGTPATWYSDVNSVPGGSDPIWSSVGTRDNAGQNWTWQTPVQVEGVDGTNGASALWMSLNAPATVIACDYLGNPKSGAFTNAVGQATVFYGATDVTASTTFGKAVSGCTGDVNDTASQYFVGAKGAYRITAISADAGYIEVSGTYNSVTVTGRMTFTRSYDATPLLAASLNMSSVDVTATTYPTTGQGGPLQISVGPGGTVHAAYKYTYAALSSGQTYKVDAKIQYREVGGGSWLDFTASEQLGATVTYPNVGQINAIDRTMNGPSTNKNYEFQWVAKKSGTSSGNGYTDWKSMNVWWSPDEVDVMIPPSEQVGNSRTGSGTATAGYRFGSDGKIYSTKDLVNSTTYYEMVDSPWLRDGAASAYETRYTNLTGSGGTFTGPSTWTALSANQTYELSLGVNGFGSRSMTVEIRRASDQVVLDSMTLGLDVENT